MKISRLTSPPSACRAVPGRLGLGLLHSAVTVNYMLVKAHRSDWGHNVPQGIRRY
jgi:hypothetical protein